MFQDSGINPQMLLQPVGKHVFMPKPPAHLNQKYFEYPYMALAVYKMNRPTGGSSRNPVTRRLYFKRLKKQLPLLIKAMHWLENLIENWKEHSADTAPKLIAQAEDLMWYMRKEPNDLELNVLFDRVRPITSENDGDQLLLLNAAIDVLEYIDSFTEKGSQQINEGAKLLLDAQHANADFLMGAIASLLELSADLLVDYLRHMGHGCVSE
jgi:hypothetical protein